MEIARPRDATHWEIVWEKAYHPSYPAPTLLLLRLCLVSCDSAISKKPANDFDQYTLALYFINEIICKCIRLRHRSLHYRNWMGLFTHLTKIAANTRRPWRLRASPRCSGAATRPSRHCIFSKVLSFFFIILFKVYSYTFVLFAIKIHINNERIFKIYSYICFKNCTLDVWSSRTFDFHYRAVQIFKLFQKRIQLHNFNSPIVSLYYASPFLLFLL